MGSALHVHAQDVVDKAPAPSRNAPISITTAAAAPFWVAGVVITLAQRSAVLVPLDEARRETGVVTLREGESYEGYRLATVEPTRVLLEQNGAVFSVMVGRPHTGPRGTPDAGPRVGPIFIPGPDRPKPDLEYTGPQVRRGEGATIPAGGGGGTPADPKAVENFIDRLFNHPQMQERIEEIRPVMRERLERARQDGHGVAAPPAPASKPSP